MSVLVIGAGGHSKVVADILQLLSVSVAGLLDDNSTTWGTQVLGFPVLGGIDQYADFDSDGLILGIGSNKARCEIVARLGSQAEHLWIGAVHPSAVVASSVILGRGVVLAAHTVVNPDVILGDHVIVNTGATIDHDCRIGDFAHIAPGCHLAGGIEIGAGVLLGIGTNAIPNVKVGNWSIVGAGSTVIRDIPDHVTAIGTPAHWSETLRHPS